MKGRRKNTYDLTEFGGRAFWFSKNIDREYSRTYARILTQFWNSTLYDQEPIRIVAFTISDVDLFGEKI